MRPATTDNAAPLVSMDADDIIARIEANPVPSSVRATADLSLQSPLYSGSMTARITHRREDSLMVTLAARGLGIEAGRLLVTQDSFFLFNRLAGEVTVGTGTDFLPGFFGTHEAMVRLLGLLVPNSSVAWDVQMTEYGYLLHDASSGLDYTVDTDTWRVISMERRLPSGQLAESMHYGEFSPFGDGLYPQRVTYRSPVTQITAQLYIRRLTFDRDIHSLRLGAPPGVKRVAFVPPG